MLKRKKKFEHDAKPFVADSGSKKKSDSAPKSSGKANRTVIGKHVHIEGNISGEEHVLIEGSMKGKIDMPNHDFQLGHEGRFEGEINALTANIGGQMKGNINSHKMVVITKDANYTGDIKTKTISLEDGAYFKGNIELDQKQKRKPTSKSKTNEASVQKLDPKSNVQIPKKVKSKR
jgi:cytoskeletal protein CcmA (bactofilin family)